MRTRIRSFCAVGRFIGHTYVCYTLTIIWLPKNKPNLRRDIPYVKSDPLPAVPYRKRWRICARVSEQHGRNGRQRSAESVMELRFRESAVVDVRTFVTSYIEGFFELYSDTGIWSEDAILQNVFSNGEKLFRDLYDAIEMQLSGSRVLGRKKLDRGWYECRFRSGTRLIIVYYSEDKKARIRWIESMHIERKPIIF